MNKRPIYMDYQATTPLDERVLKAMMPYLTEKFGNPHSGEHAYGWEAEAAIQEARSHVAHTIGAGEDEIIFTSGATESNNLAIQGVAHFYGSKKKHLITWNTEHKAVLGAFAHLQREGFSLTVLSVDSQGLASLEDLKKVVCAQTLLVSLMTVNNEIGVIQPVKQIADWCQEQGIFFHSDAAQAFGKMPLRMDTIPMSLMSISGHKIYAPKGVGALYIRRRPAVRLLPLTEGGGQEKGLRPGTLPTHQIVGLGEAARLASLHMTEEEASIEQLGRLFYQSLVKELPDIHLNGHPTQRLPGSFNISFDGVKGESLIHALKRLAVSSGSACASASTEPSYVLAALGVTKEQTRSAIRFSIGRMSTKAQIEEASAYIVETVKRLRS